MDAIILLRSEACVGCALRLALAALGLAWAALGLAWAALGLAAKGHNNPIVFIGYKKICCQVKSLDSI